jgi:8-oxo-(d)GTP phosphatase
VDALTREHLAVVRAAGGVVWRRRRRDDPARVLLVHRPRYDDWSLPKGKLHRGEHPIAAACREVEEETGVRVSAGVRLPSVGYRTRVNGNLADKVVDYWAMTVIENLGFSPGRETDELAWLSVDRALDQLSYAHDVEVLTAFARLPPLYAPVVLLRHARAGDRRRWRGPDADRPLDPTGLARARELAVILGRFHPARLVSAAPLRCIQTLEPLAAATGLTIDIDTAFDETADPQGAARRLRRLGRMRRATIVCSQDIVIPHALAILDDAAPGASAASAERFHTAKGRGRVLSFTTNRLAALDELA